MKDANDTYELLEIKDIPVLLVNGRVSKEDIHKGFLCFSCRQQDQDDSLIATLEPHGTVRVNHFGDILCFHDFLEETEGDCFVLDSWKDVNWVGEEITPIEFENRYKDQIPSLDEITLISKEQAQDKTLERACEILKKHGLSANFVPYEQGIASIWWSIDDVKSEEMNLNNDELFPFMDDEARVYLLEDIQRGLTEAMCSTGFEVINNRLYELLKKQSNDTTSDTKNRKEQ